MRSHTSVEEFNSFNWYQSQILQLIFYLELKNQREVGIFLCIMNLWHLQIDVSNLAFKLLFYLLRSCKGSLFWTFKFSNRACKSVSIEELELLVKKIEIKAKTKQKS